MANFDKLNKNFKQSSKTKKDKNIERRQKQHNLEQNNSINKSKKFINGNTLSSKFCNKVYASDYDINDIIYIGLDLSLTNSAIGCIEFVDMDEALEFKTSNIMTYELPTKQLVFSDGWKRISYIKNLLFSYLDTVISMYPSKQIVVCLEWYAMFGTSVIQLVELGGPIRNELEEKGIEFIDIPPTSLKKFITGNGNAVKSDMITAVQKQTLYDVNGSDDVADALACALYLRNVIKNKAIM